MLLPPAHLAFLGLLWLSPAPQDVPGDGAPPRYDLALADPAAREAWDALLEASGRAAASAAIEAFQLQAEVLTREELRTNEGTVRILFLVPDAVRFTLESGRETGRFGLQQREHWLKEGAEVVWLAGRDYSEDRRLIERTHAVARNFISLSDPARLRLAQLETLAAPPPDLPTELAREARELRWIRATSPDFALFPAGDEDAGAEPRLYAAELGLRKEDALPRFAIVREARLDGDASAATPPLLFHLQRWERRDGTAIPGRIDVHAPSPDARRFASRPAQEVHVVDIDLDPALSLADFRP